jgi:hypothetical protein
MIDSNQNVKDIFKTRKRKQIINALIPLFVEKRGSNITEFYDLLGELIKEDFEFFLNACYFSLKKNAAKIISATTLSEMDKYVLENFCFNPEEQLIASTRGQLIRPKGKLTGFLYLTNFRLIGDGVLSEQQSSPVVSHSALRGGIKMAVRGIKHGQVRAVREALKQAMGDKFSDQALKIFPHHFPIMNAYNIKKGSKSVSYTMTIDYEQKGKMKSKVMNFKIVPKKEKGESSTSFFIRLGEILNAINETLLKAQS